ncbi:MAG: CHAT domain-containing protein [Oscillochloridaceae bacterium]|nr:CHAT domain-containing protein [Chloroflexaceae bacterium]MDW8391991.1 CHAT domain-containing protein [Oscillochloridaceae bacterium]
MQTALVEDEAAWREYHGHLIARLAARAGEGPEGLETLLAKIADQERALAALRAATERLNALLAAEGAPAPARFENRDLEVGGELVQAASDITLGLPPDPSATAPPPRWPSGPVVFQNVGLKVNGSVYQSGGNFTRAAPVEEATPPAAAPGPITLTLRFTPASGGAQVRWRADELGEFSSDLAAPYRGRDLAAVLRALERRQHPAFALAEGDAERLRALGLLSAGGEPLADLPRLVGQALYAALVREQGLAALALVRSQAAPAGRPLALRLLLPPEAVELAALPWELLWPPREGLPLLLGAAPPVLLTRHLDLDGPLPRFEPRQGRPLRILSLVPEVQRAPGDLAETRARLGRLWDELRARGVAEAFEVSPVTREDLRRAMEYRPDIVQFTGHGWYAEGRGVLLLDPLTPGAPAERVEADRVAVALRGARMVVLAACRGAQGAGIEGGAASLLTGVAPALSAAGAPLVLGMQLGIGADAALRAVEALYAALARGLGAQAAVGEARAALYVGAPERDAWYVPALYVRSREAGPVVV